MKVVAVKVNRVKKKIALQRGCCHESESESERSQPTKKNALQRGCCHEMKVKVK